MSLYSLTTEYNQFDPQLERVRTINWVHGYCDSRQEAIDSIPKAFTGYHTLNVRLISNSDVLDSAKFEVEAIGGSATRFKPFVKYIVHIQKLTPLTPGKLLNQRINIRVNPKSIIRTKVAA